jgi:hypothetical protein
MLLMKRIKNQHVIACLTLWQVLTLLALLYHYEKSVLVQKCKSASVLVQKCKSVLVQKCKY